MLLANLQGLKELNATKEITSGGALVEKVKIAKLTYTIKGKILFTFSFK